MGKLHIFKGHYELLETITELEKQNKDLKLQVSFLQDGLIPLKDLNDTLQLESYRKLQSEVHLGIERVWSIDNTLSPSPEDLDKYIDDLMRTNKIKYLN